MENLRKHAKARKKYVYTPTPVYIPKSKSGIPLRVTGHPRDKRDEKAVKVKTDTIKVSEKAVKDSEKAIKVVKSDFLKPRQEKKRVARAAVVKYTHRIPAGGILHNDLQTFNLTLESPRLVLIRV